MRHFLAILLVLFIAACGSEDGTTPDDGDDGGNNGGGNPTHADTVRVQTLQTIADQLDQWEALPDDEIATRAVDYLNGLSSIADAGITPGTTTVWANFTDGFSLIIPNNREPSTMADTLVDARSAAPSPTPVPAKRIEIPSGRSMKTVLRQQASDAEIPESARFRALNAIGTCHINPVPGIRALLTAGNYDDALPGAPTVAGLKSVNGDGVFYINSHGGPGFDANQVAYYAIWTLDSVTPALLAAYKPMIDAREVVGMIEWSNDPQGNCLNVMHFGITSKFVSRYMSFSKNSLVIVDACFSATAPAQPLRDAFMAKGASVYVGWSKRVGAGHAYAAMKYLLDRILGLNLISPEDPKQRAFNIFDVRDDMAQNTSLLIDPVYGGELKVFELKDDFGLLAPSIQFLSVEESALSSTLLIAGMFGSDPGEGKRKVTINDQPLDVVDWQPTLILCDLPLSGSSASGTVVVHIGTSETRRSNPVNLTEWKGKLTYERDDPGSMEATMEIDLRFRADLHSFRDKPHEPPFETIVLFAAMRGTSIDVTTSGSYAYTEASCTHTFTFTNGANLPSPYEAAQAGGWIYFGQVDTQNHELLLNINMFSLFDSGTYRRTGPSECDPGSEPLYVTISTDDCLFDDLNQVTAFRIGMSADFNVPADTRGPCSVAPLASELRDIHAEAKIKWDEMTAFFPPDPDAAR